VLQRCFHQASVLQPGCSSSSLWNLDLQGCSSSSSFLNFGSARRLIFFTAQFGSTRTCSSSSLHNPHLQGWCSPSSFLNLDLQGC
jgi:hypothetical protein